MTGTSLGLRMGSNGSLHQSLQNNIALPIRLPPFVERRQSKTLTSGAKEKERLLPWICKMAGRRRDGMLLLVAFSLLVFLSLVPILNKEEDAQEVVVARRLSSEFRHDEFTMISYRNTLRYKEQPLKNEKLASSNMLFPAFGNENRLSFPAAHSPPPNFPASILFTVHPCNKFVVPPPPTDRRRMGPRPCPVCYIPVEQAIALMPVLPSITPVLKNLTYIVEEDRLIQNDTFGGSDFGGYPTLAQRDNSYDVKESMTVHCGFVRGNRPGHQTGFDIDAADLLEMKQCHGVVVASAIFGNYDEIQQPKHISDAARRDVCFFMFVDEKTFSAVRETNALDSTMKVGLWRVVVVKNLPYMDPRRNGKVPKLLLHRLFPNVRFSIWIDGKLELVVDPFQLLERFLWRTKATFAISRHYRRFDVFEEAEANKVAGKYSNASIDEQIEFYKKEGLTPYSSSKLPITSDVPEGCVIIREHIPITNLFTCLWFNEVDRFTSRDQLSFSTVRDKIMSKVNWSVNMFFDCERRNFVVQAYHRDVLEWKNAMRAAVARPLPVATGVRPKPSITPRVTDGVDTRIPARKAPLKRSRERKSGSRRHRSRTGSIRESIFS